MQKLHVTVDGPKRILISIGAQWILNTLNRQCSRDTSKVFATLMRLPGGRCPFGKARDPGARRHATLLGAPAL